MSVWELVCAVGVTALGCGMVVALVGGRWRAALAVQAAGMAAVGAAGAAVLFGAPSIGAPFRSGYAPALGIDRLSGFFLLVLALIAVPAVLYARDALRDAPRAAVTAVLSGAFCLALVGLVAARDVTTFLAFWELMTLLPASAILRRAPRRAGPPRRLRLPRDHPPRRRRRVGRDARAGPPRRDGRPVRCTSDGVRALVRGARRLVGFGTKAGLMPLHSWLPRAHPLAPATSRR